MMERRPVSEGNLPKFLEFRVCPFVFITGPPVRVYR